MEKDKLPETLSNAKKPFVAMSIGVPGSGKSTVLTELSEKTGIKRINPDEIRAEITGSETDQSKNKEVWDETCRRVKESLEKGESIIVDATHTEAERRPQATQMYRDFGAKAVLALNFSVDLDTAKRRNQGRTRVVPDYVLERMHKSITEKPASTSEGFDEVIEVDNE